MSARLLLCALLSGCAISPAPPGTQVPLTRLQAVAVPGATRDSVRAALGDTTRVRFDSGAEVWQYLSPAGGGTEFVILFGPDGRISRTRQRAPHPLDPP
ncbi:MAG: hypothetical protein ACLGI6_02165 [Gammaproteobacteria bacterium]